MTNGSIFIKNAIQFLEITLPISGHQRVITVIIVAVVP
jgi:hypothetical protein